jgi:hypothetical protein
VRSIKVTVKEDELTKDKLNFGYFALLVNDIKDPIQALETYRRKVLVEKSSTISKSGRICTTWLSRRECSFSTAFPLRVILRPRDQIHFPLLLLLTRPELG